jgi:hypothetical protein
MGTHHDPQERHSDSTDREARRPGGPSSLRCRELTASGTTSAAVSPSPGGSGTCPTTCRDAIIDQLRAARRRIASSVSSRARSSLARAITSAMTRGCGRRSQSAPARAGTSLPRVHRAARPGRRASRTSRRAARQRPPRAAPHWPHPSHRTSRVLVRRWCAAHHPENAKAATRRFPVQNRGLLSRGDRI